MAEKFLSLSIFFWVCGLGMFGLAYALGRAVMKTRAETYAHAKSEIEAHTTHCQGVLDASSEEQRLQIIETTRKSTIEGFRQGFEACQQEPGLPLDFFLLDVAERFDRDQYWRERGGAWIPPKAPEVV